MTSANITISKGKTNPRTGATLQIEDYMPNLMMEAHCLPLSSFVLVCIYSLFFYFPRIVVSIQMGQTVFSEISENPFLPEPLCSGLLCASNEIKPR